MPLETGNGGYFVRLVIQSSNGHANQVLDAMRLSWVTSEN